MPEVEFGWFMAGLILGGLATLLLTWELPKKERKNGNKNSLHGTSSSGQDDMRKTR